MTTEVAAADVVRVVLQFLRESGLRASYEALAEESQVPMNCVDNVQAFTSDVVNGRWESVLPVLAHLRLPPGKQVALYEHIVLELTEMREIETARALLRDADGPLHTALVENPARADRLERIVAAPYFDAADAYGSVSREKRRRRLADALSSEVYVAPSSRLMSLIGQALKWQQYQGLLPPGTDFDLFRDSAPVHMEEEELPPRVQANLINFGKAAHAEAAVFSPDGQMLITGSADGFVEVWDYASGKLRTDLPYQAEDNFMMHGDSVAVLSMAVSRDGEMLATGGNDGKIKVWKLKSGKCLRRFEAAHAAGVSSLCFSRDGSQILSASFDTTMRIHGLKSGKLLKEFRGHDGYVNAAIYCSDATRVASASSDGSVKFWDARTTECVHTMIPPETEKGEAPVIDVVSLPKNLEHFVVCTRSRGAFIMNDQGAVVRSFAIHNTNNNTNNNSSEGGEPGSSASGSKKSQVSTQHIVSCELSPRGEFLYCLDGFGVLHALSTSTGASMSTLRCHQASTPYGLTHHPHRNLIATFASDSTLKMWQP